MPQNPIVTILKKKGYQEAADMLVSMHGAELNTLLMHVMSARADMISPSTISTHFAQNRFVSPSIIDQRAFVTLDWLAYQLLDSSFQAIELAPVVPFGTNRVLAGVNQKNILGVLRGTEVLADPTTALALITAQERASLLAVDAKNSTTVRLATSSRSLRGQNFEAIPGFVPHFKTIALASAGRDIGHELFEKSSLFEHLFFYLRYIKRLQETGEYSFKKVRLSLSDVRIMDAVIRVHDLDRVAIGRNVQDPDLDIFAEQGILFPKVLSSMGDFPSRLTAFYGIARAVELLKILEDNILEPLRETFSDISFEIDLARFAGIGYYSTACFKISAENSVGTQFPLADGGLVPWTQSLLSSRKERLFISGLGTELLAANFKI